MLVLDTGEPGRWVQHILHDSLIDGVLVSAVAAGEAWVEQLLSADIPAVLIGEPPDAALTSTSSTSRTWSRAPASWST